MVFGTSTVAALVPATAPCAEGSGRTSGRNRLGKPGHRPLLHQLRRSLPGASLHPLVRRRVLFLTFFTNLVLFACFLGMSVGLLATGRRGDLVTWVIPLAVAAVGLAELASWAHAHFANLSIDIGGQASPQQVFFGPSPGAVISAGSLCPSSVSPQCFLRSSP